MKSALVITPLFPNVVAKSRALKLLNDLIPASDAAVEVL